MTIHFLSGVPVIIASGKHTDTLERVVLNGERIGTLFTKDDHLDPLLNEHPLKNTSVQDELGRPPKDPS